MNEMQYARDASLILQNTQRSHQGRGMDRGTPTAVSTPILRCPTTAQVRQLPKPVDQPPRANLIRPAPSDQRRIGKH
jgi:hypothetical protein